MIKVFEPKLSFSDKLAVFSSIMKNEISGSSPIVKTFEENTAKEFDRKYASAVSNGSVALDLAFQSLNLSDEDEIIIPSFTIISALAAVIRSGGKPVFCDVDHKTWNMTIDSVKGLITKNTKALLLVHTYGLPADASEIEKLCLDNNIELIEDSAEAHGQFYENRKCGSFGKISTMSFYANKHVTSGEGGMILTNDEDIYEKINQMKNLDFSQDRFKHKNLYWNYRLGGLQAALGNSQLNNMKQTISQKIEQGNYYNELLKDYSDILQIPEPSYKGSVNHYWVYGIVLNKQDIRDKLIKDLMNQGIETRPFFHPLHLQDALPKKFSNNLKLPVSENIGRNGLYLPLGNHLKKSDQNFIVKTLLNTLI